MAKKKIIKTIKIQGVGAEMSPSPIVSAKVGKEGIKPMEFCKSFNAKTQDKKGELLAALVLLYGDKSYDIIIKSPPVATLIKKELNLEKGSGEPNRRKVGTLSQDQLKKIALLKLGDTNAFSVEAAMQIVAGSARSMGVEITL